MTQPDPKIQSNKDVTFIQSTGLFTNVTFSKKSGMYSGIAELSLMKMDLYLNDLDKDLHQSLRENVPAGNKRRDEILRIRNIKGTWFYFNRIFVPRKIRNLGIGRDLIISIEKWADSNKYNILCEVNPYGDMKYKELEDFYIKHGFERTLLPRIMIRLPKIRP